MHTYVNDYTNVTFLCVHIVTCIFITEIVHVLLDLTKNKIKCTLYIGVLEYVANARGSWVLMKGATPGDNTCILVHKKCH